MMDSRRTGGLLLVRAVALTIAGAGSALGQQSEQNQDQSRGQQSQPNQQQGEQRAEEQQTQVARSDSQSQSRSDQANPFARADGTWITLTGTVEEVRANAFTLNFGDGTVVVEMDDADRDADGYDLAQGDQVTVAGRIDDDLFEETAIEASSVYVPETSTFFFASAMDEEDIYAVLMPGVVYDPASASVMGRVAEVESDEFTIDAGTESIRVDVDEMPYDPLDAEGYQQIEVGDFVSVTGNIDQDFFEGRELKASSVITLSEEVG